MIPHLRRAKQLLLVSMTCVAALGSAGCDTELTVECRSVLEALTQLQKLHLAAATQRGALDPAQFQYAQISLLAQRHVKIPEKTPHKPLEQCEGTLELLRQAYPQTPIREFTLDLLTNTTRQWDPHSVALSEQALSSQSGFLRGFGFSVERSDDTGRVEVVDVIAGSPAHIASLQEGMFIWTVNRKYVREISTTDLVAAINDRNSESLSLGVLGGPSGVGGVPLGYREIRVSRGTFEASPVKFAQFRALDARGAARSIGYLKIRNFSGAQAIFAEDLRGLRGSDALVLDLRNISGGEIEAARDIADLLLADSESFVGLMSRSGLVSDVVPMKSLSIAWDNPLVVLVNATTKSAAEILAGTLQDHGAIVVGTRTFGKGTRQTLVPLAKFNLTGGVFLTDAYTVRPSGKLIQFQGITPDIALQLGSQPKLEENYPHALKAPADVAPLPGYDPTGLPTRSRAFRARLAQIESEIRAFVERRSSAASQEDLQLEAAKQAALFLIGQADRAGVGGAQDIQRPVSSLTSSEETPSLLLPVSSF
ncbi:MAG: PDZ domain-containing protein [Deltaproteobacteria bacterium]|nr:PDZ domain-containing protein [Deltaproteobacteria bacterium]